ncbi:GDP-fucose protein O-fucosyltransferase [Coniochaeta hoffmannii]|uniref:GDP-fucose protein O-fucosyltransferase n=1 Tax=Coniochaeta hoffmannii TaxID=91930 RepID=A0AA38R1Z6_9PEZI|nr:GDP-fucose protein O-fucosyltransferase [Coniochaeta hoffmannii]
MTRQRNVLLAVCLISLATIWSCRLPRLCIFDQCNADITAGPLAHRKVDLSDLEAPFIGWPLARVCNETEWEDGLVFVCDNNSGGIGNIRGYILTCLRYAIEAGATGLVMPQIRTRSDKNLADIMQEYRDFDYFFDADHFRTGLTTNCPRITIYDNTWAIPNFKEPHQPERITPRSEFGLRGGCDQRDLNRHTDLFGPRFRQWLSDKAKQFDLPPTSLSHPRVVRMNWGVQLEYPVYRDGPEVVATFGGLLRFRKDILELGKRTVEAMRDFASTAGGTIPAGRFVGFHLRTESDALAAWPSFENQTTAYLSEAAARGFKAAYLATGNGTEAAKFVERARSEHDIAVTTKQELLNGYGEDLSAIQALTWDQQALIDFIVLLAGDFFLGVNPSSFSMNVALKRHLQMEGLYTRPWRIGRDDGRSLLVGKFERYWDDWLFMYDSIWP